MDLLKKLKLPVASRSEPVQPQAQPQPAPQKAPPEYRPPLQASVQAPVQPLAQTPSRPQDRAAQHQPQAPVWAQTGAPVQRQPVTRPQGSAQPLKIAPRVVARPTAGQVAAQAGVRAQAAARAVVSQAVVPPATSQVAAVQPLQAPQVEARTQRPQPQVHPLEVRPVEAGTEKTESVPFTTAPTRPATIGTARIRATNGGSGPTGYLGSTPGFWRTVWTMHPNRTKRRLRRLLLSWEKLGAYISSAGAGQELTPTAETAFLRAKIDIARSVGYLKLLDGTGGIAKEADQKEAQFIELLERFPSLHSARTAGEAAKRNLYYNWHQLYLFLHKMLGASPYEAQNSASAAAFGHRVETMVTAGKTVTAGGKKTG